MAMAKLLRLDMRLRVLWGRFKVEAISVRRAFINGAVKIYRGNVGGSRVHAQISIDCSSWRSLATLKELGLVKHRYFRKPLNAAYQNSG